MRWRQAMYGQIGDRMVTALLVGDSDVDLLMPAVVKRPAKPDGPLRHHTNSVPLPDPHHASLHFTSYVRLVLCKVPCVVAIALSHFLCRTYRQPASYCYA